MGNSSCLQVSARCGSCESSGAFRFPWDCLGPAEFESMPKELRIVVPRGPRWASGIYKLVEGQIANGYPLWKSKRRKVWLYSTLDGKWAICGKEQEEASFYSTAGFVFCGTPHRGRMPEQMPRDWLHNHPAWTLDPDISVTRNDYQIEVINADFNAPRGLSEEQHLVSPTDDGGSSPEREPCADGTLLTPDSGRRECSDKRVSFG
mmetsp:Transcript_66646/g.167980  ORF Transcript_66646/g.167980 Transcript_66646/m.167980 type:complete len:205 (-) Transcript_66646:42-656(-)